MFPFTPNIEKSVPFIYMRRSADTTENYKNGTNRRKFNNLDVVLLHIETRGIPVYDVKDFSNLKEQIEVVEKAKVIIVEHGSAFLMNGILFARNSHIIILNKLSIGCMDLEDRVCKENGNTYEFIESMGGSGNIIINIQELSNAINLRIN
jgi:capsular polysaccharide biosynthesis protein